MYENVNQITSFVYRNFLRSMHVNAREEIVKNQLKMVKF